jgi:hypothetical protein
MSKIGNNEQFQKQKISKLAIASTSLGILGLLIVLIKVITVIYPDWVSILLRSIKVLLAFLGLIFGAVAFEKIKRSQETLKGSAFAILGIIFATLILHGWLLERTPRSRAMRSPCGTNLYNLAEAMRIYAHNHDSKYPAPEKWCDLLLEDGKINVSHFVCPYIEFLFRWPLPKRGRCHYAINPNCEPNSPADIILLFETKEGWNQFGGPEILTFENHKGSGCNVLLKNGPVKFVRPNEVGKLKWGEEKSLTGGANDVRRPASDEELRYWLENMVWYHRFSDAEIRVVTGLTYGEIETGRKRFNIRMGNRPERGEDDLLLVLPYPGGRHPRIGFLEGAINPQRETKFSVFTPWDANSYVVVDLPEAIWSNLGLTYLAHTHIDTIWSKQGIVLQKLEWNRRPDGTLDIERELPDEIAFGVKVRPTKDAVLMELWMKNGTQQRLSDLRVQICVMTKMAAGFEEQTNDNKVFTNPYVACRSKDGKKWIITAWENCDRPWGNERCPCFHSDPKFADMEPGATGRLRGWLSFYEGPDVEAEFKRIDASGWRK